jgi:hypothetical protein
MTADLLINVTLESAASDLNRVSDWLTAEVERLNEYLKKLNLGVEAWELLEEQDQRVGYGKMGNWGILIRQGESCWPFSDAPRFLRVLAVPKLPCLLIALTARAAAQAEEIRKAAEKARQLAEEGTR